MGRNEKAILKTLFYADIFHFPLTKYEIWKFLISNKKISINYLFNNLQGISKFIETKDNYLFIKGKNRLVNLRDKREKASTDKLLKAQEIINKISFIPTVKLIGISGALSMKNSDIDDDIDLFVISKKNFVWTTRFMLIMVLIFLGKYRHKNSKNYSNKICLNMILDEDNIFFKKNNQNLYTAHEIVQLIPILNIENTYEKFIAKNNWVKSYLANFPFIKNKPPVKINSKFNSVLIIILKFTFFEEIIKFIQIKYMQKGITNEVIEKGFLAFHPFNYNNYVLKTYNKNIEKYKI